MCHAILIEKQIVNKVFKEFLGNTIEAYMDDVIMKSKIGLSHVAKLSTVFDVLRKHNLRLNPTKCSVGVQSQKLLGYMMTQRGIETNL